MQIRYVRLWNLQELRTIANLSKTLIEYGTDYAGVTWYKNAEGTFERQPLITANLDILYYQDASDETNFGVIRLVDQANASDLRVEDIIGKTSYTSPNGVVFTNGLKIQFIGAVVPASYENQEYYVEGVGTAIDLLLVTDFITPETYTVSALYLLIVHRLMKVDLMLPQMLQLYKIT